jgi:endonuclease/exonuclease/phosphatase family metal-dependent hydrolase
MNGIKLIICCVCFFIAYGCAPRVTPSASVATSGTDAAELRILCYNIHHANPPSRPNFIDINAIANVITQQRPDIVALQEVDVHTDRSGKTLHQAKELARLTGMQAYFAKAIDYGGGEYGVAVLSRLPMSDSQNRPLPTATGTNGEPRTLGSVVITLPKGKKVLFAFTHLDAQSNSTNRLLQIRKINELLAAEKLPVILAGDLNAAPGSEVINVLDSSFTRTCIPDCGFTIPVERPNKTIDFIAYKPASAFIVMEHKVIDEKYASDHLPVFAVLKLKE